MVDEEGLILPPNENPNEGPDENLNEVCNQVPNLDLPPNLNPPPPPNPLMPNAPMMLVALPRPQLNWSHFKPEYAGKPNEDAEAHLL